MALSVVLVEKPENVTASGLRQTYQVRGVDADYNAIDSSSFASAATKAAYAAAPATVAGFAKRQVSGMRQLTDLKNDRIFTVEISFGAFQLLLKEPPPANDVVFSWNHSPRTLHVNYALSHDSYVMKSGEAAPTNDILAIDVDAEGNPRGADIFAKESGFTLAWTLDNSTVTNTRKQQWEDLLLTTNDIVYGHRAIGEVLFYRLGGSTDFGNGRERHEFEFLVRKNISNETVSGIPAVTKTGWQRLDPLRTYTEDVATDKVIEEIIGFNILNDYPVGAWSGVMPPL